MATPNPASYFGKIRQKNLLMPPQYGNDLPQQGGFTGNVPFDLTGVPPPDNPTIGPYRNIDFGANNPIQIPPAPDDFDPMAGYHPEHVATDAYSQLAAQYPTEKKAGGWRRIGGAALGALTDLGTNLGGNRAGVKGTDVYDEMTGRNDYEKAVKDWQNKIGPAGTAANLERYSNANERQVQYQAGQQQLSQRRIDEKAAQDKIENENRARRTDAYTFKNMNPTWKFEQGKDGTLRAYNPNNPAESMILGKTGMSDIELAALNQQNKMTQIGAQGANAANVANITQEGANNRQMNAGVPMNDAAGNPVIVHPAADTMMRPTVEPPNAPPVPGPLQRPGAPSSSAESETQKAAGFKSRTIEIWNKHPELHQYMQPMKDGSYSIKQRGQAWTDEGRRNDAAAMATLTRLMYPEGVAHGQTNAPTGVNTNTPQPRFTPNNPPPAPAGWQYVPDGQGGWIAVRQK